MVFHGQEVHIITYGGKCGVTHSELMGFLDSNNRHIDWIIQKPVLYSRNSKCSPKIRFQISKLYCMSDLFHAVLQGHLIRFGSLVMFGDAPGAYRLAVYCITCYPSNLAGNNFDISYHEI